MGKDIESSVWKKVINALKSIFSKKNKDFLEKKIAETKKATRYTTINLISLKEEIFTSYTDSKYFKELITNFNDRSFLGKNFSIIEKWYFGRDTQYLGMLKEQNINVNIIKSQIKMITSRIGSKVIKISFTPRNASIDAYINADLANDYFYDVFETFGFHAAAREVFENALIYGTGILYLDGDVYESIHPKNFKVDPNFIDSKGELRIAAFEQTISYYELIEKYPDLYELLKDDEKIYDEITNTYYQRSFMLNKFYDSYTKIEGVFLKEFSDYILVKEYPYDFVPFEFFHWQKSKDIRKDFWGVSLVEDIVDKQANIETLLKNFNKAMESSGGFLFLPAGTDFVPEILGNSPITVIREKAEKNELNMNMNSARPTFYPTQGIGGGSLDFFDALVNYTNLETNTNEIAMGGALPANVRSAKAISYVNQVQDNIFTPKYLEFEQMHINSVRKNVKLFALKDKKIKISRFENTEEISFQDIKISLDEFSLRIDPISRLSKDPSARIEQINELQQLGLLQDIGAKISLLDGYIPDVDGTIKLMNATTLQARKIIKNFINNYKKVKETLDLNKDADVINESLNQEIRNFIENIPAISNFSLIHKLATSYSLYLYSQNDTIQSKYLEKFAIALSEYIQNMTEANLDLQQTTMEAGGDAVVDIAKENDAQNMLKDASASVEEQKLNNKVEATIKDDRSSLGLEE